MRRDNVRTVELGGVEYEIEASLGAGIAYKNEFFGKLEDPYVGSMEDDLLRVWVKSQEELKEIDDAGNVVSSEPNPDYGGVDIAALLRLTWAMWSACDDKATSWKDFERVALHANVAVYEVSILFNTVVVELGGGCTFRKPEGHAGPGAADEEQEA